jgi:hypothetical protein
MLGNGRGRGTIAGRTRTALVIGAAMLGATLAGCATGSTTAAGPTAASQAAQNAAAPGTATATAQPAAPRPAVSQSGAAQAAVPWPSVGAGWVLDTYSTGTVAKPAPVTLYLVSPAAAKYPLFTWPASATPAPYLEAWAGDKTSALFQLFAAGGQGDGFGELNLVTGKMTRVAFPSADVAPLGYTLPDGQQILGATQNGADTVIARYTRAGTLVQALVTEHNASGATYSPDGTSLAVPAPGGLQLLSNAGSASVKLPQAASGTITSVNVPGMTDSPIVVTASGTQLLVEQHGCHGSGGRIAWYNPATGAEQWLFKSGAGPSAVAYKDPADGTLR